MAELKVRVITSAFYYASLNVKKDYANDMTIKSVFISNDIHQIISEINKQADNSIQSIDFFIAEQDYRHGTRRIYHNGKLIGTYTQKGRISANTINEMLAKAGVE